MINVRLLAVFVENQPGQTARVTRLLAESGINIRWATIANSGSFGVMKFLIADPERGRDVLKLHGLMASYLEVVAVEVADRAGALSAVADCLAKEGINLDNTSGFVANQRAVIIVETHDVVRARAALAKQNLRVLLPDELMAV